MTILTTLIMAAIAVYIGKKLLSESQNKSDMQPIRIETDEQRKKHRR